MLLKLERSSANFFLGVLDLCEELLVFCTDCLDCVFKALYLETSISIVSQDVFLLDLKSSDSLLSSLFFIHELLVLSLEHLICMRALAKLLIDKAVLSRESLYVLSQLSNFLSLELGQLSLLLELLLEILQLLAQHFNLLLALKKLPLVAVIFADNDTHLVLHVAELKALLL